MVDPNDIDAADMPMGRSAKRRSSSRTYVEPWGLSHPGKVRSNNEDHYLIARTQRSLQTVMTNLPEGEIPERHAEIGCLMMIADGMGGAAAGEVASRMAIGTLVNLVLEVPDWIMRPDEAGAREIMRRGRHYYEQVDSALAAHAKADPNLIGMGTTMTVAYCIGSDLFLAHAGDTRAYLLRQGRMQQLTQDHTHIQELVDAGLISHEEAATHKLRHVLTNALGGGDVQVDVERVKTAAGDRLLLCSDGLNEMVDDATLCEVLERREAPERTCRDLVDLALERGGRDNVTVIVADLSVED
jgi:protein phosphatase